MYTLQTFEEKANSITTDKIKILNFSGVKKPVTFICLTCGREQTVAKGEVLLRSGKKYQCQFCHYTKERATLEKKHKIENLCAKKNVQLIKFTKVNEKATFKCGKCGMLFDRMPQDFLRGQSCPHCEKGVKTYNTFMQELHQIHGDEYRVLNPEKYKSARTPILIQHSCGFVWQTTARNLLKHSCPKCARKTSKGEKAIQNFLETENIDYIWQWKKKIEEKYLFFDFYLPKYNLAIEFQGEQHYIPVRHWGGEEAFLKRRVNDQAKRDWCKRNNIKLLEIKYTDFIKINQILASSTTISQESTFK